MYSILISHFVHPVTPSLHSTCSFASFELANTLPAYRSLYGILSSVAVNQPIRTVLHIVTPYMERPPSLICKQYHIWKWSGTDRHLATPCLNMSLHHGNTHTHIYINHHTQRCIQMARNSATPIDMQAIPYLEIVKRRPPSCHAPPSLHHINAALSLAIKLHSNITVTHTNVYKPPYAALHSNGTRQCHAY